MDVLFPRFCVLCGFVGAYLCPTCLKHLTLAPLHCIYCNHRSLFGYTHPSCKRKNGVDGVFSLFAYNNQVKTIIHKGKYEGAWRIFGDIKPSTPLFVEWALTQKPLPTLQPAPLHTHKQKTRGYNQAKKIIASCFSFLGWDVGDYLIKMKETTPQAPLKSKKARSTNVYNTIRCVGKKIPEHIVLVDDVITTGATIKECARALKEKGVQTVLAVSLARG